MSLLLVAILEWHMCLNETKSFCDTDDEDCGSCLVAVVWPQLGEEQSMADNIYRLNYKPCTKSLLQR